ncbi:phosphatase PAP2 family protein [Sneathiella sp.]|uniref:phosphatase PAP2 family protein n=1 Tax=Sneathiella sp. TaxID=1964365 RepID=UPI00262B7CA8|nr:phosphatase PAP2 family protein [Sneathiella sp.]MDF2367275.1 phosphatase PAP2 family protein [Sneathiella sp.]
MSLSTSDARLLRTRITLLIVCTLSAVILLMSNLTGFYDVIWRKLDIGVFRILNDTITPDGFLTQFWAWTNSKTFDQGTFVAMLAICIYMVASTERKARIAVMAKLSAITFLILLALLVSKKLVGDFIHPSPGLVLSPFNNINDYITGYTVKTSTDNSFPGDHAMTSALFAGGIIMLFRDRPYIAILSVLLMVFVCLPRLAGGGHWLTDAIVGGGAACLILLPWLVICPMVPWIERQQTRLWNAVIARAGS